MSFLSVLGWAGLSLFVVGTLCSLYILGWVKGFRKGAEVTADEIREETHRVVAASLGLTREQLDQSIKGPSE